MKSKQSRGGGRANIGYCIGLGVKGYDFRVRVLGRVRYITVICESFRIIFSPSFTPYTDTLPLPIVGQER